MNYKVQSRQRSVFPEVWFLYKMYKSEELAMEALQELKVRYPDNEYRIKT